MKDDAPASERTSAAPARNLTPGSSSSAAPLTGPIRNRWALLVGVNHYIDRAIPDLGFCVSDVLALERILKTQGYTTVVLHDGAAEEDLRPTRDNVEAELARLCRVAGPNDLLWVHFAGHGRLVNGKPVLITSETREPTLAKKALPLADVERSMRQSRARRLVLTLDACHTGVEIGRDLADPEFLRNAYELAEGFALLAASTAQGVAQEWQEREHGVFTYFLLDGLSGQADRDQKGFVTVDDLRKHVVDGLRRWYVEQGGLIQEPTARTEGLGDIILAAGTRATPPRPSATKGRWPSPLLLASTFVVLALVVAILALDGSFFRLLSPRSAPTEVVGISTPTSAATDTAVTSRATPGPGESTVPSTTAPGPTATLMPTEIAGIVTPTSASTDTAIVSRATPGPGESSVPSTTAPGPTATVMPATSGPDAGDTWTRPKDGAVMVYVPDGEFLMGSTEDDPAAFAFDKPSHTVYLNAFWIDKTEVTNAQYRQCVEAGACSEPDCWDKEDWNSPDQPVVCVDWYDALTYAAWVGGRLPTEAEWEKAARGTDGRIYPWGNEPPDNSRCNFAANVGHSTPAGQYSPAGDSPYGCADMAGNVQEWTQSIYREYPYDPDDGRENLVAGDGVDRVLRGGSAGFISELVRCASRNWLDPSFRDLTVGFRVVVAPVDL